MSLKKEFPGRKVAILAYDGLCTFEFGIAIEVFALSRPELEVCWYTHRVFSVESSPIRATGGFTLQTTHGVRTAQWADTIIVPGWRGITEPVPESISKSISLAYKRGARIVSICSGVKVLAEAGILAGRYATTHWRYIDQMRREYSDINFKADQLYVEDNGILTSAGSAAGLDLCLHLVRSDYGTKIANSVAKRLVLPSHREGGQKQFIPHPITVENRSMGPVLENIRMNLSKRLSVSSIAVLAKCSERTLMRRFKDSVGQSPLEWLTAERITYAKSLLENSALNTGQIAEKCGFQTTETFRHHFKRLVGVAPMQYRNSFSLNRA